MARPSYPLVYTTTPQVSVPEADVGVSVTTTAGAYSDSLWVEVTAGTTDPWTITGLSIAGEDALGETEIDIGIGAAGSEVVVATLAHYSGASATLPLPIPGNFIPAATRVAVRLRCQTATAGKVFKVALLYYSGTILGRVVTCPNVVHLTPNVEIGVPAGTLLQSGTPAWTNGVWFDLQLDVSSSLVTIVPYVIESLHISPLSGPTAGELEIDLGHSTATVYTTIRWSSQLAGTSTTRPTMTAVLHPPFLLPVGSRLQARLRTSTGNADLVKVKIGYRQGTYGLGTLLTTEATAWFPPAANGLALTTPASSWGNSSWVQVTAATATAMALTAVAASVNAQPGEVEIDIGQGAAGAEVVIGTVRYSTLGNANGADHTQLRLLEAQTVAAGVRLALRARSSIATSHAIAVALGYVASPTFAQQANNPQKTYPGAGVDGVSLAGAGSGFNASSWGELVAATATDILLTGVALTHTVVTEVIVELGVGAAGSEVVITELRGWSYTMTNLWWALPVPHFVPAGVRVAVRFRQNSASASARLLSATYVASPAPPAAVVITPPTQQWMIHRLDIRPRREGDA